VHDTDDLIALLNQFRSAELRGAGVILRLGRLADTSRLRVNFTRHLRDEGVHAWLWTRCIEHLGGEVVEVDDPYQSRLGAHFGLPRRIEELLAVTLVSERRGVSAYEELLGTEIPAKVSSAATAILKDERWHVSWISQELAQRPAAIVEPIMHRAVQADLRAAAEVRAVVTV